MSKVLILGCGPAGLMAAAAAEAAKHEVVIVGKKRKSEMYGAQYLHMPIRGYSPDTGFEVKYLLLGSAEEYRRKVYGDARVSVSPEDLAENHEGWDIRSTYDRLWLRFSDRIQNVVFNSGMEVNMYLEVIRANEHIAGVNHFISTIPAPLLCVNPAHAFPSQNVWAIGDAPERGVFCPITQADLNTVLCSGTKDNSWYRTANILGYRTAEWPENKRPPLSDVSLVRKPINTNCDCLPFVHRMGRYGKWQKGVLSHEAYYETLGGLLGEEVSAKEV